MLLESVGGGICSRRARVRSHGVRNGDETVSDLRISYTIRVPEWMKQRISSLLALPQRTRDVGLLSALLEFGLGSSCSDALRLWHVLERLDKRVPFNKVAERINLAERTLAGLDPEKDLELQALLRVFLGKLLVHNPVPNRRESIERGIPHLAWAIETIELVCNGSAQNGQSASLTKRQPMSASALRTAAGDADLGYRQHAASAGLRG